MAIGCQESLGEIKNYSLYTALNLDYGTYDVIVYVFSIADSCSIDGFIIYNTMSNSSEAEIAYESDSEDNPQFTTFVSQASDTEKFKFNGYDESDYPTLAVTLEQPEFYLYPGCSVTFKVNTDAVSSMQLNMRSLNGAGLTYTINSVSSSLSAVAMYYPIDLSEDGEVTITNTSTSSTLAIDGIKYFSTSDVSDIFLDL